MSLISLEYGVGDGVCAVTCTTMERVRQGLVIRLRPLGSGTARRSRDPQYPALDACHSALWRGQDGLQEPGQGCVVVSA